MDYLQYYEYDGRDAKYVTLESFKPYYKWITFNTKANMANSLKELADVLNLIINGLPSILRNNIVSFFSFRYCFKPYYKWITFNTHKLQLQRFLELSFKPYYKWITFNT